MSAVIEQRHFGSGDNVAGDKYVQHITQVLGNYYLELEISEDEMYKQIQAYCDLLVREHSYFPMLGVEKSLEIEKVYVTLSVATGNLSGEKSSLGTEGQLSSDNALLADINPRRDLGSPHRLFWNNSVPLNSILFHNKSVVLGEPGIGKTTLLKRMLINICKGKILSNFVPVFISLTEVNFNEVGFVYDYLNRKHREYYRLIEHCIIEGKAIIFFDGLDEIDKKQQEMLSNECNALAAKNNKIVVSSRTTVFPRNLLASDFKIFECVGFSVAQRRKFLRKWFADKPNLSLHIEKIVQENPVVWGMSRNPLLLSLIAIQFENSDNYVLSPKRINLFLQGIDELLNRRNGKTSVYISFEDKRNLLRFIAFQMFSTGKEIINKIELQNYITLWYSRKKLTINSNHTVDDIIEYVIEVDGILSHYSKNHYRFLHLTFQEALTAKYIFDNKNWMNFFISKRNAPRWEETLRLLVSQLSEKSAIRLSKLLYYRGCLANSSGESLCVSARYLCELSVQDLDYQDKIFLKLQTNLLTDKYSEMYNDVVVALSEMCNANKKYIQWYIEKNEKALSMNRISTYIQVLKLSHSSEATAALLKLLSVVVPSEIDRETKVVLIGKIISALESNCDYGMWAKLYQAFMDENCSYLSAVLAKSLANILPIGFDDILNDKIHDKSSYLSPLCQYVALKYESESEAVETLKSIFEKDNVYVQQLIPYVSDLDIHMDEKSITDIISNCHSDQSLAIFLSLQFIFFAHNKPDYFIEIIRDRNKTLGLRYAALESFLIVNANRSDAIDRILDILSHSNLQNYIFVFTRVLEHTNIKGLFDFAIKNIDEDNSEKNLISLLRLLAKVEYKPSVEWLISVLRNNEIHTDIYFYALLALCKQRYSDIQSLLMASLNEKDVSIREKTILLKSLILQNRPESVRFVISILEQQNDINLISLIVDMLPSVISAEIERALLQYLDFKKWPRSWPAPLPELKKGEQRQSDRRKLSIVVASSNLRSRRAISLMKRIANDKRENDDVRHAAFVAYKNMAWRR